MQTLLHKTYENTLKWLDVNICIHAKHVFQLKNVYLRKIKLHLYMKWITWLLQLMIYGQADNISQMPAPTFW